MEASDEAMGSQNQLSNPENFLSSVSQEQAETNAGSSIETSTTNAVGPAIPIADPAPGPSGTQNTEDFRNILGDIDIPEGVDPSFLAALPEDMRQEVISEHLR